MTLKIKVHERCAQEDTPPAGGLPPDAPWEPTVVKIKDLKKGDFFTLKPIEYPKESQVWVLDSYDRYDREWVAIKFSDIGDGRGFKGDKTVYTGFTF